MPVFVSEARTAAGQRRQGKEEAGSAPELARTLRARGLLVLNVKPEPGNSGVNLNPLAWLPPSGLDIELFLQQLAVMVRSGITLLASLRACSEQARRQSMSRICDDIADRIQGGTT